MKGFRPGIAPTLLVSALLALLVGLGTWQLARGESKRLLLATYSERRASAPVDSAQLPGLADPAFRRVQLHGEFDARHSYLLDNRVRDGQVGVELLQPFQDQASGLWVLVNRGWLPWPERRTPVRFSTPAQALSLQAWVYVAPGATFQLRPDPGNGPWPRLITAVEPAKLWAQLGRQGFAHELRAEPGPGTYASGWPVLAAGMGPEKHQAYAVQWFAMAAALFALYLYFGWHNAREKHHGSCREST